MGIEASGEKVRDAPRKRTRSARGRVLDDASTAAKRNSTSSTTGTRPRTSGSRASGKKASSLAQMAQLSASTITTGTSQNSNKENIPKENKSESLGTRASSSTSPGNKKAKID